MSKFQTLTVATVIATLMLIAVGSTVRTTGSGLGCPDWPLCHGRPLPPLERTAIIEWSHRTTAAVVSVLIVVQAAWTLIAWRRDQALARLAVLSIAVLGVQAALGAITVVRELPPEIVAIHLVTALALLAVVGAMAGFARQGPGRTRIDTAERRAFTRVALWVAVAVAAVLTIGAYTVATNGGFGCTSWPGCPEAPIPFFSGARLQTIHWLHRFTVLGGAAAVTWLFLHVRNMREAGPWLRRGARWAIGLYALQIVIGAGNILARMADVVRISHLAVGSAIWVVLVLLVVCGQYRAEAEAGAPGVAAMPRRASA